jgi:amidase
MGMEGSVDHVGPMARTADDLRVAMSVMAGPDGDDYRQLAVSRTMSSNAFDRMVDRDLSKVTLGLVDEAFRVEGDAPEGTTETSVAVRDSIAELASLGASVRTVSVPGHLSAPAYLFVLLMESAAGAFMAPTGGYGHKGAQDWSLDLARMRALGNGLTVPATVRITAIMGARLRERYWGATYSWVRGRIDQLDVAIELALAEVDFIVMPTATHHAHRFVEDETLSDNVTRGWDMFGNTISTSLTGHPAITLPMSRVGVSPVGVMFVARKGEDANLLKLAEIIEDAIGWYPGLSA